MSLTLHRRGRKPEEANQRRKQVGIIKDITGQKFGRLTVVKMTPEYSGRNAFWICECVCGTQIAVHRSELKKGSTKSCGCLRREAVSARNTTHGLSCCENPDNKEFHNYGALGTKVCERWHTLENFIADIGERPSPKHSIDRHPNPDGNYEPGNIRWATPRQQVINKRKSETRGVRERQSGAYQALIKMPGGTISLGIFKTHADALDVHRVAELARAADIIIRRGSHYPIFCGDAEQPTWRAQG
jgi:hypothetical protein